MSAAPSLRIGTQGWAYPDWVGTFFPPGAKQEDYLPFYAEVFDTVEIDTTFYHPPKPSIVRSWARHTPEAFRFTAKLPQAITHTARLASVTELLQEFARALEPLGPRLGAARGRVPPPLLAPPGELRAAARPAGRPGVDRVARPAAADRGHHRLPVSALARRAPRDRALRPRADRPQRLLRRLGARPARRVAAGARGLRLLQQPLGRPFARLGERDEAPAGAGRGGLEGALDPAGAVLRRRPRVAWTIHEPQAEKARRWPAARRGLGPHRGCVERHVEERTESASPRTASGTHSEATGS
ncbi:MAG: DUF72 domain-containing protein [Candidatus Eisenbacteria bacterium]|uniref:DUF72 domain-containing protein n=1 Tax=Eiseniibacteriota bacterium TaxID=2212470 RepID=A0A538UEF1_UNCEI|nr:MAG: DUF72 domain-containing protein [Candidatus Eisenbacteria bacterium]